MKQANVRMDGVLWPLMMAVGMMSALASSAALSDARAGEGGSAMRPAAALKVLVEARDLNARCGFVPEARDELVSYAAKAEIAAAAREGAEAVKKALREAREEAKAAACDAEHKDLVIAALEAAREAMRQLRAADGAKENDAVPSPAVKETPDGQGERETPSRASAPAIADASAAGRDEPAAREPRMKRESAHEPIERTARVTGERAKTTRRPPRRSPRIRAKAKKAGAKSHRPAPVMARDRKGAAHGKASMAALKRRYVRLAGTYYLDLRCKGLPYPVALSLYRKVKALHYRLLRQGGPEALRQARAAARARARLRSCRALKIATR